MRSLALLVTLAVPSLAFANSANDLIGTWQVDEPAATQAQKAAKQAGNDNAWVIDLRIQSHTVLRFDGKTLVMESSDKHGKQTEKVSYKVASTQGDQLNLATTDAKNHADSLAFKVSGKKLFWVEGRGIETPFVRQ